MFLSQNMCGNKLQFHVFSNCQLISKGHKYAREFFSFFLIFSTNFLSPSRFQEPPILQGRIYGTAEFLNCILRALFRDTPLAHLSRHLAQSTWHLAHHQNLASGVCLKRAFKMQFRKAYFRSLVHPSRKLWPKPNSGNSVPCILPCKIGDSWNLMKEQYLSKTSFLTLFIYQNET